MTELADARNCFSVAWRRFEAAAVVLALCVGVLFAANGGQSLVSRGWTSSKYIIQGISSTVAKAEVRAAHGIVVSTLPLVDGVVAKLTSEQVAAAKRAGLQVWPDLKVTVQGTGSPSGATGSGVFTSVTGATTAWGQGLNGSGVSVAVIDTGIDAQLPDLQGRVVGGVDLSGGGLSFNSTSGLWARDDHDADDGYGYGGDPGNSTSGWGTDQFGHGTFVAGLIASSGASSSGEYEGVAPDANLVSIKVAGASGITTEGTVIEGIEWAIANQNKYGIRVLNLSLGTIPTTPSLLDPLDSAATMAWRAGLVVVTSAGNFGPYNGTITSPGNDPVAITVGAMNDNGNDTSSGYTMTSFSSVGPTFFDGWFKPDLVAPGQSVVSLMAPNSTIDDTYPQASVGSDNFVGSGTSFSTAIVSGLAALLIQQNPNLTPDQVKAALLYSASPGPVGNPFVDGHGVANVAAAATVAGQVALDQRPALQAQSMSPPVPVSLATTWGVSSWNPANWSGPAFSVSALEGTSQGSSPAGSSGGSSSSSSPWAGAAWNGAAWNGAAWNGAAWNGAAWNGAAWNGAAWNGAAWNGAAWNGAAWNGAAWNGAAWNGAAWNGAAWNGDSWGD